MYRAQLEDADIVVLNKCDLLDQDTQKKTLDSLRRSFPNAVVVPISAYSGEGFAQWTAAFAEGTQASLNAVQVDWDYLASGDRHMGWYNKTFCLEEAAPVDLNRFCLALTQTVGAAFRARSLEIAHFKVLVSAKDGFCKAALTSAQQEPVLSDRLAGPSCKAHVYINMRALAEPEVISAIINSALRSTTDEMKLTLPNQLVQAFSSFDQPPAPVCEARG